MLQIHSPKFSNSGKNNISAMLSPTYRSKRTVSDLLTGQFNHMNSNKKLDSPSKLIEKKRNQNSQHRAVKPKDMLVEMSSLKEEYMNLKAAYKEIMNERMKQSQKETILLEENQKMRREVEKVNKENSNLSSKITFLEEEIERIKRESLKLIEVWELRMKKLEEDLSEKCTYCCYSEKSSNILLECLKNNGVQLPAELEVCEESLNLDIQSRQHNKTSHNSSIFEESLFFGKMHVDMNNSVTEFDNVSLSSMVHANGIKTDEESYETAKPLGLCLYSLEDITNKNKNEDNKKLLKNEDNFKKFRKEISKRIEVNIDDKHKEFLQQIQPKTPLDRKNGKSTKSSKAKLKDEQENKSSKKKNLAR